MELERKKSFLIDFLFAAVIAVSVYFAIKYLIPFILPFIIGVIIAFLIQKPAKYVSDKTKIKKGSAACVFAGLSYLLFAGLVLAVAWALISSGKTVFMKYFGEDGDINNIVENLKELFNGLNGMLQNNSNLGTEKIFSDTLNSAVGKLASYLSSVIASTVRAVPAFLVSTVVTIVASCYIAKDYDQLIKFLKNLLDKDSFDKILQVKEAAASTIMKMTGGYLTILLITFFELLIGFFIAGVDYVIPMAAVVAVVDILPIFGTGTILLPWSAISMLKGNFLFGIEILAIYLAVTFIRNFIEPRIIGKRVGINPLLTLLAMFIGLKLSGIFGMIVVPLAVTVTIAYFKKQIYSDQSAC